jgi:Periplasmic copper-binding protein (NosD)
MFRLTRYVWVLSLLIAATEISHVSAGNSTCPAGTRAQADSCVLDSDLVLDAPLVLESLATLNCRGHRLLPLAPGSGTTPDSYVITADRGVDIRNCTIGEEGWRFDFGIIALNSKDAGKFGHRIHDNEINVRDSGITFLRVDDAQVNDNVITWSSGYGISFARDSDRNRINDNIMSSTGSPPAAVRLVPGGPFRSPADDGLFMVAHYFQPLYNVVIAGRLYQFPNFEDGQYQGNDDNVLEGNHLSLPGSSVGKSHGAIEVGSNSRRTRVIGNTITAAGVGIRLAGAMAAQAVSHPGVCLNPEGQQVSRLCQTDADCFIPWIDPTPVGTCSGLLTETSDRRAHDTVAEDNILVGPFNSTTATRAGIFGGNGTVGGIIRRDQVFGTGIEPGITLAGNMIETGVVTGNIVLGASIGLMLQQGPAASFGARVFLNDIIGSTTRAVGVSGTYTLPTELSSNGTGNFWGHASTPCFTASDTPLPLLIQDSYPFCATVAVSTSSARR